MLRYHTFFAQYQGDNAEDIIKAIYKDSKSGTTMNFGEWWAYQRDLWKAKYNKTVPDQNAPNACKKLLAILVDVGALESGAG